MSKRRHFNQHESNQPMAIMWESEYESVRGFDYGIALLSSTTHGLKADGFELRGRSWHVGTDIPSDLLVEVGDVDFYLHKYLLFSRSGKMTRLVYESREPELSKIVMNDLPGGADAFLLAAKFCYGVPLDLTGDNIAGLRCAAEYLEMTEDYEEGNLIFKTEAFLSYVVLSSWSDSIIVLKSCENLSPWAENLQVVRRCCDSIAWKACANPKGVRWSYTGKSQDIQSPNWNGVKEPISGGSVSVPVDWWFKDASILRIDHFVRVITSIKVKGMRYEQIGAAIVYYASMWLPDLVHEGNGEATEATNCSNGNGSSNKYNWNAGLHLVVAHPKVEISTMQEKERRMIIESLVSILPPQKDSVSCTSLLQLLRMANVLKVAPALVTELEKRVGMQFEQATLSDLLIPSYNRSETMYDVDLIQRLLEHFLVQELTEASSPRSQSSLGKDILDGSRTTASSGQNAKMQVARLVDSYLTEVAKDGNLSLTKFQVLAEALPESARSCDDGLYRAVDSYLKAHPTLSEHERKRLCRVMDCQKLSVDACMHAAQNERLPLRVVVQVLFSEQMKINNAIAKHTIKETGEARYQPITSSRKTLLEGTPQSFQEGWTAAKKDINTLKFELDSVKTKYLELHKNLENLQNQFEKILKQKQTSSWSSGWKKLSKLTKMNVLENQDLTEQVSITGEKAKKTHRRWRNSIS